MAEVINGSHSMVYDRNYGTVLGYFDRIWLEIHRWMQVFSCGNTLYSCVSIKFPLQSIWAAGSNLRLNFWMSANLRNLVTGTDAHTNVLVVIFGYKMDYFGFISFCYGSIMTCSNTLTVYRSVEGNFCTIGAIFQSDFLHVIFSVKFKISTWPKQNCLP